MPRQFIQCSNVQSDIRCGRRNLLIVPKGVTVVDKHWKCATCEAGQAPFTPRESARKGQQKQAKK